jgi:hypothetical protein
MYVTVLYLTPNQRVRRKAGGNVGTKYKIELAITLVNVARARARLTTTSTQG